MALIAMAVHDTDENNRTDLTVKTLINLSHSLDFEEDRLFIIDNGSCDDTKYFLRNLEKDLPIYLISLPENIGTAAAINLAWKQRGENEHCVKMDNDVVISSDTWVEEMIEAIERDPTIGQVGLKRKDCWEHPAHENPDLRSKLISLPHVAGQRWITVEKAKHIMGTCVMHSSALLDKIGYLYQPGLYGYDDVLCSWRANLAGFYTCFLPHIDIDHIDPGDTPYQTWKERHSGQYSKLVSDIVDEYITGKRSLYYNPYE